MSKFGNRNTDPQYRKFGALAKRTLRNVLVTFWPRLDVFCDNFPCEILSCDITDSYLKHRAIFCPPLVWGRCFVAVTLRPPSATWHVAFCLFLTCVTCTVHNIPEYFPFFCELKSCYKVTSIFPANWNNFFRRDFFSKRENGMSIFPHKLWHFFWYIFPCYDILSHWFILRQNENWPAKVRAGA